MARQNYSLEQIQKDKNAFRDFYEQHKINVYNTALGFLKNVDEAEEVTQDVFVTIYQSAAQFSGKSKVSTWVYRITVNKCLDRIRNKKNQLHREMLDLDTVKVEEWFAHPGVAEERQEDAKLLFNVIDNLAENQRIAFTLSFVENLPRGEVAEIMELSLKAVESLLQRAKQNLRKELEKYYPNRRK